jgi:hypothetical protein
MRGMRLIFIVLLVANIAFFGFQVFGRADTVTPKPKADAVRQFGNLQTLAERNKKAGTPRSQSEAVGSAQVSSAASTEPLCQLVGPFGELLRAEYLVERLAALEVPASIRNLEVADGRVFWVYLKPEMSEKEALRRLYEVQAKSIESYIISSGELANGISLGQFSDDEAAKNQQAKVRELGYAAEIKEVPKTRNEIWVDVKEQSGRKINADQWANLLKEEKAVERRENYCLGVANP